MRNRIALHSACLGCLTFAGVAHADTVTTNNTVASTGVIYASGTQSSIASGAGGTLPTVVSVASGSSYFTFSVPTVNGKTQTITLNNGTGNNNNDADGAGAAPSFSYNSGYRSISGITAPGAGYLTGVFVAAGGPTGIAPTALNFTTGTGTSFTSLNPLLDQVFFIGDGLTGDGTGSTQQFYVPTGATTLYLGISDAPAYFGGPGAYGANVGSFSVTANDVTSGSITVTPEPSSLLLLGTGALGVIGTLRRRRKVSR